MEDNDGVGVSNVLQNRYCPNGLGRLSLRLPINGLYRIDKTYLPTFQHVCIVWK